MQTEKTPHKAAALVPDPASIKRARVEILLLPSHQIVACKTFRDAVRLAWFSRSARSMTKRDLADALGVAASHLSNMLNRDASDRHGKARQDLPARLVGDFERAVGNHAVTQYLTRVAMLTLVEEH